MKPLDKKGMFGGKSWTVGGMIIGFISLVILTTLFNSLFPTIQTSLNDFAGNISEATGIANLGTVLILVVAFGALLGVLGLLGFRALKK